MHQSPVENLMVVRRVGQGRWKKQGKKGLKGGRKRERRGKARNATRRFVPLLFCEREKLPSLRSGCLTVRGCPGLRQWTDFARTAPDGTET